MARQAKTTRHNVRTKKHNTRAKKSGKRGSGATVAVRKKV